MSQRNKHKQTQTAIAFTTVIYSLNIALLFFCGVYYPASSYLSVRVFLSMDLYLTQRVYLSKKRFCLKALGSVCRLSSVWPDTLEHSFLVRSRNSV